MRYNQVVIKYQNKYFIFRSESPIIGKTIADEIRQFDNDFSYLKNFCDSALQFVSINKQLEPSEKKFYNLKQSLRNHQVSLYTIQEKENFLSDRDLYMINLDENLFTIKFHECFDSYETLNFPLNDIPNNWEQSRKKYYICSKKGKTIGIFENIDICKKELLNTLIETLEKPKPSYKFFEEIYGPDNLIEKIWNISPHQKELAEKQAKEDIERYNKEIKHISDINNFEYYAQTYNLKIQEISLNKVYKF